jgi:hypothetical protein
VAAQDLELMKGKKLHRISREDEITVFADLRGIKGDSVELMLRGKFEKLSQDSLYLSYWEFARHNYYRHFSDSSHYEYDIFKENQMQGIIALKHVNGIYRHRSGLTHGMTNLVFVSMGAALATIPFVIAMKPGEGKDVIRTVNLVSTITMLSSATVGFVFAKRKYDLRPGGRKSWKIRSRAD